MQKFVDLDSGGDSVRMLLTEMNSVAVAVKEERVPQSHRKYEAK